MALRLVDLLIVVSLLEESPNLSAPCELADLFSLRITPTSAFFPLGDDPLADGFFHVAAFIPLTLVHLDWRQT